MQIDYLEIVTPNVDEVCATYEAALGVTFGGPIVTLGNARTADLNGGGRVGVRAPMHESEQPVVRPYFRVADVTKGAHMAEQAGAMIAHPPMELPGQGAFSIFIQGGIQSGLWRS